MNSNATRTLRAYVATLGLVLAGAPQAQSLPSVVDFGNREFSADEVREALTTKSTENGEPASVPRTRGLRKTRTLAVTKTEAEPLAREEKGSGTDSIASQGGRVGASSAPTESQKPGSRRISIQLTFDLNSANLTAEARRKLDIVGVAMQSRELAELTFIISGHTDITGPADYNLKLSTRRADAVAEYLVGHQGIVRDRLLTVGKGADELLDPEHPSAEKNRRVQIEVVVR